MPPRQSWSLIPLSNPQNQTKDSLALRDSQRRHWAPWSLRDSLRGQGPGAMGAHTDGSHMRGSLVSLGLSQELGVAPQGPIQTGAT